MILTFNLDPIKPILQQNGPTEDQFEIVNQLLLEFEKLTEQLGTNHEELTRIKSEFTDVLHNSESMFGHVIHWPHGYPGDYEIIDRIYRSCVSPNPEFSNWDKWFHQLPAPRAVRNRKTYFKQLVKEKSRDGEVIKVLNLASGPCRDLLEFFEEHPTTKVHFDCVDLDPNAIAFAKKLLGHHKNKVTFHLANVFKYDTIEQYDLIWSAGLFDYFDDKNFVKVLGRYLHNLQPGGEIVIGNFYIHNSSRSLMQFFGWILNHRTYDQMLDLAKEAGFNPQKMRIESEPEGINMFLRIWK